MRLIMNSCMAAMAAIAVFCGGVAGLFAGGDGDSGAGTHTTTWTTPQPSAASGSCVWWYQIGPATKDDPAADDPEGSCMAGPADAYAHAIADGMQIWGYAWAKDVCLGSTPSASSSAASSGWSKVYLIWKPEGCAAAMDLDWKPRFKLRVELVDNDGEAKAGGRMKGDCNEFDVHLHPKGALRRGTEAAGSTSLEVAGVGVELSDHTGEGVEEETYLETCGHLTRAIAQATANYECGVNVSATADASFFNYYAEAQCFAWDSLPGLDLFGYCTNCSGSATVTYGWY